MVNVSRKFLFLVAAILAFSLAACGSDSGSSADDSEELSSSSISAESSVSSAKSCDSKETSSSLASSTSSSSISSILESPSSSAYAPLAKEECPQGKDCVYAPTEQLNPEIEYGQILDRRDYHIYNTVRIGSQVWMAQNLSYDYERDDGVCVCFENSLSKCRNYGCLYLWAQANGLDDHYNKDDVINVDDPSKNVISFPNRGICPKGFHVPDSTEWKTLAKYIDETNKAQSIDEGIATSMKTTTDWADVDGVSMVGTNRYGFSALPLGGYTAGNFYQEFTTADFTSASETTFQKHSGQVFRAYIREGKNYLELFYQLKTDPRALRCIMD